MPSAVIRYFRYSAASKELHVVFQSGRRYTYQDVPEKVFLAMKAAFSKGEYFNEHVRNQYRFVRD
jgi:lysyl-tRNA synthetase class 2